MDVDAPTLSATKRKFSNVEEIRVTSTVDGRKVDLFKVPLFEMTQNTLRFLYPLIYWTPLCPVGDLEPKKYRNRRRYGESFLFGSC
jgi:hypothetical protein